MPANYSLNPSPTAGVGIYGAVPGQLSAPTSVAQQLQQTVPGYGGLTSAATGDIQSELAGTLSPQTMSSIQNYASAHGVALGQPGNSPIANEIGLSTTGNTVQGLQAKGLNDYNTLTGTAGSQQIDPALQTQIAEQNSVNAAAPNPESAAQYALSLYQQYMNPSGNSKALTYNPSGNVGGMPTTAGTGTGAGYAPGSNSPAFVDYSNYGPQSGNVLVGSGTTTDYNPSPSSQAYGDSSLMDYFG